MKNAAKVVMGLAVLMFFAAVTEAQVSEPKNQKLCLKDENEETFDITVLIICLAGLLIAGVVASPFFKKVEEVCEVYFFLCCCDLTPHTIASYSPLLTSADCDLTYLFSPSID